MPPKNPSRLASPADLNRHKEFAKKVRLLAKRYNLPPVDTLTFKETVEVVTPENVRCSWRIVNGRSVCVPLPN
jgi:hypothetical protein